MFLYDMYVMQICVYNSSYDMYPVCSIDLSLLMDNAVGPAGGGAGVAHSRPCTVTAGLVGPAGSPCRGAAAGPGPGQRQANPGWQTLGLRWPPADSAAAAAAQA